MCVLEFILASGSLFPSPLSLTFVLPAPSLTSLGFSDLSRITHLEYSVLPNVEDIVVPHGVCCFPVESILGWIRVLPNGVGRDDVGWEVWYGVWVVGVLDLGSSF